MVQNGESFPVTSTLKQNVSNFTTIIDAAINKIQTAYYSVNTP